MLAHLVGGKTDVAALCLRAASAAVFIVHGFDKLNKGMDQFTPAVAGLGFPAPHLFALAAALVEFVGGVFVALGLFTRYVALLQAIVMGVAIVFHFRRDDPFRGGWEFAFVMLMVSLALVVVGPGRPSLDRNAIRRDF